MSEDRRIPYDVPVMLRVLAEPGQARGVEKTVLNYLRDYVPDEASNDPIHIKDFTVGNAKPVMAPVSSEAAPEPPAADWSAVHIKMAMLHGLLVTARKEIADGLKGAKDRYQLEGFSKVLQYFDLGLQEMVRTRHQEKQEVCFMFMKATGLVVKAYKIEKLNGLKHLLQMPAAFGLEADEAVS